MTSDEEGFAYPNIDASKCTNCGLCEKFCPVINQSEAREPLGSFAAINPNEDIRLKSSSGGIFSLLAEKVVIDGGVVFGAKFNEKWEVVHDYTETIEDISQFRGSKYVQSRIGDNYIKAKQFLDAGRKVLFSGTPCQIAGLKLFLRKDYSNLLSVDIICHGVPSPIIWKRHINKIKYNNCQITNIYFRDKSNGWETFNFHVTGNTQFGNNISIKNVMHSQDAYMKAFLYNLSLRPSCYKCAFRNGKGNSDITIADLWNWNRNQDLQHFQDNKGTSLVLSYTSKGNEYIENCLCLKQPININDAIENNISLVSDFQAPKYRSLFFRLEPKLGCEISLFKVQQAYNPSLFRIIAHKIKKLIQKQK